MHFGNTRKILKYYVQTDFSFIKKYFTSASDVDKLLQLLAEHYIHCPDPRTGTLVAWIHVPPVL